MKPEEGYLKKDTELTINEVDGVLVIKSSPKRASKIFVFAAVISVAFGLIIFLVPFFRILILVLVLFGGAFLAAAFFGMKIEKRLKDTEAMNALAATFISRVLMIVLAGIGILVFPFLDRPLIAFALWIPIPIVLYRLLITQTSITKSGEEVRAVRRFSEEEYVFDFGDIEHVSASTLSYSSHFAIDGWKITGHF